MTKTRRRSATDNPLPFVLEAEPARETLTSYGGVPLVVQTFRSLGLPQAIAQHVRIKQRQSGYDEGEFIESFVVLNAVGGECLEDFDQLRADPGLSELIGHGLPSPEAARNFLYEFHEDAKIEEAQLRLKEDEKAYIPEETVALQGLAMVNRHAIVEVGRRCPDQKIATVDQDATIIESRKKEAKSTYEGTRGYQPMLAVWAETGLILSDEFRDGNVPAMMSPLASAKAAFSALPPTVETFYYRGDSASHEHELMSWLRNLEREGGPKGFIGFAISARMSDALQKAIEAVPEDQWQMLKEESDALRSCAEVAFVPGERSEKKDSQPLRYIAIRIQKKQGHLYSDGDTVRHFAVVTNIEKWSATKLIQWHREKAGTIELVHDVLKNELAAGVLPCGRFGSNAAWLRLAVITHNILTALKRLALPAEYLSARPKRLRFLFLNLAGRVLHHARTMRLRLATAVERLADIAEAFAILPLRV
jgi:DDE family transposase